MTARLRDVRRFVYEQILATSAVPSAADVARALSLEIRDAEEAFRSLADARMLVLRPGTTAIWMAMPFSSVQTPFTVVSDGRAYSAACAWDAFGAAAVLDADARIFTTCADCGGAIERKISGDTLHDPRGVVHVALPARRWWDDIGFT